MTDPPPPARPVRTTPPSTAGAVDPAGEDGSLLVEDQRFAIVPEWVIDAPIPDSSYRLYTLLLRYGGTSGARMPSRPTLARRMRRSVDAVDRAMRELVAAGMVRVEHRRVGQQYLSNRYHVRTSAPLPAEERETTRSRGGRTSAATLAEAESGGRTSAATPRRASAATVAAEVRPDPEALTESTPPPPSPSPAGHRPVRTEEEGSGDVLVECGVTDLAALAGRCAAARTALGQPVTRWSGPCLSAALHLAVRGRSWPASLAVLALLAVATDPASRSPMRLAEAGPWWDQPAAAATPADGDDLGELEQRLDDLGGRRPRLQAQARAELAGEHLPVTRSTVVRRACEILDRKAAAR